MQNNVQAYFEQHNIYDLSRDIRLTDDDLDGEQIAKPEKVYWAAVRALGTSNYEVSVCRPFVRPRPPLRDPNKPKQVKVLTKAEQRVRDEESLKRSVRRTRQQVRHLVKIGNFDRLVTLNTRECTQDRAQFQKWFQSFIRLVRLRYPEFQYVGVLEYQQRGALHMHMAVKGKQDIRWLLRCWLKALGQDEYELQQWYIHGVKLGYKSLGNVDVTSPDKRWGNRSNVWHCDRLAGYITKYISKDIDLATKNAKRYWRSDGLGKPQVYKYWLGATSFIEALREVRDLAVLQDISSMKMFGDSDTGNIWLSCSRPPPIRNDAPPAVLKYPIPF